MANAGQNATPALGGFPQAASGLAAGANPQATPQPPLMAALAKMGNNPNSMMNAGMGLMHAGQQAQAPPLAHPRMQAASPSMFSLPQPVVGSQMPGAQMTPQLVNQLLARKTGLLS